MNMPKFIPMALVAVAVTWAAPHTADAQQQDCPQDNVEKSGTFQANIKTVGFIIGARWGEGTLT